MAYDVNKCPTFGELTRWSYGYQYHELTSFDQDNEYISFSPDFTENSDISDHICGDICIKITNQGQFRLTFNKDQDFILANFNLHIIHNVNAQGSSYELSWGDADFVTIPMEVTIVHMIIYYNLIEGIFSWFYNGNEYSEHFSI